MTPEVKTRTESEDPREPRKPCISRQSKRGSNRRRFQKTFREAANRLFNKGVTDQKQRVCFHTLRHSFGSWLAMEGVPLITIKELMGHKSLAMTERYAHLLPDLKKQAALELADKFRGALEKAEKEAQSAEEEQAAIA